MEASKFNHINISEGLIKGNPELGKLEEGHLASDIVDKLEGINIENEFDMICEITGTEDHAKRLISAPKGDKDFVKENRYLDVLPYADNIAVIGPKVAAWSKWYLNCSLVNSWSGNDKKFLASQGPMPNTTLQFWTAVEKYKVSHIFMLCNLTENGLVKCHRYWPKSSGEAVSLGDEYLIKTLKESYWKDESPDLIIREISLTNVKSKNSMKVEQYQYCGWPDHGLPKDINPLLSMAQIVKDNVNLKQENKMLVHCSAGVGRTGTFLTLCNLMGNYTSATKPLPIFRTVRLLREQRPMMVERYTQYQFIYYFMQKWIKGLLI